MTDRASFVYCGNYAPHSPHTCGGGNTSGPFTTECEGVQPAGTAVAQVDQAAGPAVRSSASDPLLTGPEAAERVGIASATWRSYVRNGYIPAADDPDDDRPPNRRSPRWLTSTVDHFAANRIGQGKRVGITRPGLQ